MNYNEYLVHHGVKGMKWGVRHDRRSTSTGRKIASSAKSYYKKKRYNSSLETYKRSKSMSDSDLKAANKRLQAEQQYRQLIANNKKAGRSYVVSLLNKSGNIFVNAAIGAAAGAGGAIVGKKILDNAKDVDIKALIAWLGAK